jgi:hypothetical protein
MTSASGNSENESTETPEWRSVLRISNDKFQQSVAVAELAVKLCTLQQEKLKKKGSRGSQIQVRIGKGDAYYR